MSQSELKPTAVGPPPLDVERNMILNRIANALDRIAEYLYDIAQGGRPS